MKIYPDDRGSADARRRANWRWTAWWWWASTGDYPKNEKGQTKYPRYEFFQQIVKVYKDSGRSVPMFNDKHLSWNWEWARRCTTRRSRWAFRYMAGSSLPVTWRTPSVEMPLGARIREALCVCYGGVDSYDFHGLETIQCMVERRHGGETGVKWVQAYRGDKFWNACRKACGRGELMNAALCRSHTLTPARAGFNDIFPTRRGHAAAGEGSGGVSI